MTPPCPLKSPHESTSASTETFPSKDRIPSETPMPPKNPSDLEALKAKIQQNALLGLARCARGYLVHEKKETFDIGPNGEKNVRSIVVTRKRVGPDLAAIQFILTNLNPTVWQLKPLATPPPPEEDPDLSALSEQTLEELAGWLQKEVPSSDTTRPENPPENRLPPPPISQSAGAVQPVSSLPANTLSEPSNSPSQSLSPDSSVSVPFSASSHEKNESNQPVHLPVDPLSLRPESLHHADPLPASFDRRNLSSSTPSSRINPVTHRRSSSPPAPTEPTLFTPSLPPKRSENKTSDQSPSSFAPKMA